MSLNQVQSEMKFSSESPATNGILESQAKSNNDGTVCNTSSQNTCWVKLNVGGKVNNVYHNKSNQRVASFWGGAMILV